MKNMTSVMMVFYQPNDERDDDEHIGRTPRDVDAERNETTLFYTFSSRIPVLLLFTRTRFHLFIQVRCNRHKPIKKIIILKKIPLPTTFKSQELTELHVTPPTSSSRPDQPATVDTGLSCSPRLPTCVTSSASTARIVCLWRAPRWSSIETSQNDPCVTRTVTVASRFNGPLSFDLKYDTGLVHSDTQTVL
jgi:hypothetical protein